MRPILRSALCLTLMLSVGMLAQAPAPRGFLYGVSVGYYVADPIYVSRPTAPARYVFFPGERIELSLELFNGNEQAYAYPIPDGGVVNLFSVTAVTAPVPGVRPRLAIAQYRTGLGRMVQPQKVPASSLEIPPRYMAEFRATLEDVSVPGLYEVRIVPVFREPLINSGVIAFERRSVSDRAARAEILYRRMAVAQASGDCARVQSESTRLLALHPTSSAVHQLRAECAERAGRNAEAVAEYDRARELLVRGLDDLFLAHADPREVKNSVDGLSSAAASVGKPRTLHP